MFCSSLQIQILRPMYCPCKLSLHYRLRALYFSVQKLKQSVSYIDDEWRHCLDRSPSSKKSRDHSRPVQHGNWKNETLDIPASSFTLYNYFLSDVNNVKRL